MNEGWLLLLVLILMLPVVFITAIVPYLTRKIESFGVTIPEEAQKDPDIAALRKQYIWLNGGVGLAVTLSLMWLSRGTIDEQSWSYSLMGHVFGYILFSFGVYLKQHYAVKRLKALRQWTTQSVQRVVVNTKFRNEKLTLSNFWFLPHVLLVLASIVVGVVAYDKFPDIIPMQYGMDGEVNRTVEKTQFTVLWPALLQSFMLVLFVLVNYIIGNSKQLVESSDPEGSLQRNIKFRRYWSGFAIGIGFLTMLLFSIMQLSMLWEWSGGVITFVVLAIVGVILAASIGLSLATGQGGSRIKLASGAKGQTVPTADHDRYWKLGLFYFNPQDPALFVEKRFGVGWTMNFGRPLGWIIMLGILLVPIVLVIFVQ